MSINVRAASDFIAKLLYSVTSTHMQHFMTVGPGAFARHEALGGLYAEIQDLADGLAEEVMGTYNIGLGFVGEHTFKVTDNAINDVQAIYNFIELNRSVLGPKSHIQNSTDALCTALTRALFKLRRLQ